MKINIVLLEPEIPYNTGNIGRTCLLTGAHLHLVKPLGFSIDDKAIKRAGLDYWKDVTLTVWEDIETLFKANSSHTFYFSTTKTTQTHSDIAFKEGDFIVFGKESKGIPETILNQYKENCIKIPMIPIGRSLNLSNSVAVVLYEALRQNDYKGIQ